jgi:hypothetical protein
MDSELDKTRCGFICEVPLFILEGFLLAGCSQQTASVKPYVIDLGILPGRLSTITYGEELPLCKEENEGCRAKNRRAHFVIKSTSAA